VRAEQDVFSQFPALCSSTRKHASRIKKTDYVRQFVSILIKAQAADISYHFLPLLDLKGASEIALSLPEYL
jgi:hypothetical protein